MEPQNTNAAQPTPFETHNGTNGMKGMRNSTPAAASTADQRGGRDTMSIFQRASEAFKQPWATHVVRKQMSPQRPPNRPSTSDAGEGDGPDYLPRSPIRGRADGAPTHHSPQPAPAARQPRVHVVTQEMTERERAERFRRQVETHMREMRQQEQERDQQNRAKKKNKKSRHDEEAANAPQKEKEDFVRIQRERTCTTREQRTALCTTCNTRLFSRVFSSQQSPTPDVSCAQ